MSDNLIHRRIQEGNVFSDDDSNEDSAAEKAAKNRIKASRIVRPAPLERQPNHVVGIPVRDIPAEDSHRIDIYPHVIFRPVQLIVPSDAALHFDILDIKIANLSIIPSLHPIPAIVFSENGIMRFSSHTCQPSMAITIIVRNHDNIARRFSAAFIGHAID